MGYYVSLLWFFSTFIIPLVKVMSVLLICIMSWWENVRSFSLCCISLNVEIIFLFFIKLMRSSLYFLPSDEYLECRSRELFTLVLMKGFLKYCTNFMSIYILRSSDEEMYPKDGIPQIVMKLDISLVQNTLSIRWDPRMNVLSSFSIPWFWAIGWCSLHLDYSLATSPRLLTSRTRLLMNEIEWVTIKE